MKSVVLFLFFSVSISAQIKGIVVDENNKPVSYVNIWIENENKSTTSEENGAFTITTEVGKNLIFSALGYEKKTVKAAEASKVVLKETAFKLDEVVIANRFETKTIEIGNVENETYQAFDNGPRIDVKFFPPRAKYKRIKFIKQVAITADTEVEGAMIKLHFYQLDSNGFPGEEMLNKDYIVTLKKGMKKSYFNLKNLDLRMPKCGMYVGFEKLMIEKNKVEKTVTDSNTKATIFQKVYYPFIMYNYVERDFFFTYSGGKWNLQLSDKPGYKIKGYEPAINLILTN